MLLANLFPGRFALFSLIFLSTPVLSQQSQYVDANVSFAAVTELSHAQPDARFAYGEHSAQFAELWQPAGTLASAEAPIVIAIHGGCWLNAYNVEHTYALNTALQEAGFMVWSLEYRRLGDEGGGWPGSWHDVQAGILALQNYLGDTEKLQARDITLLGHSAGGHLALLAGHAFGASMDRVFALAAITDLASYAQGANGCQQAAGKFMGEADHHAWRSANPQFLPSQIPTYLWHGTADTIVPREQTENFSQAAEHKWLDGAGHFDLIHPQTRAWSEILTELQRLSGNENKRVLTEND
ncbi:alpha/beta hydrolase family protein [Pseudidiomarina insulisalsae]|uniref:Alpha/beta hydrolase n=1 Tax=Pseudidiomarina insulisalsae TaxID=575789 RepID=A0A432YCZ8_9GAMM|nr:alpha/beta hydrolase [Pseudidiomarina insulisalsae]RUO58736.1 alpha/beta hydrolase [Pseudidiomarina insulisalsae]